MKDNAYRQDIVTGIMLLYASGVNYNVNSKYTKYFAQLCCRIFTFWNICTANYRLLAPTTNGTAICLVHCKEHPVL